MYSDRSIDLSNEEPVARRTRSALSLALALSLVPPLTTAEPIIEYIWTEAPFPRSHASTIAQAPDGTLIAAWFGGPGEGEKGTGVWSARKAPGAESWTAPIELYNEPTQPAWNPVLFRDAQGAIWLWFKVGPSPMSWSGAYMKSSDGGQTWGEITWLTAGMLGPVRNKPIILANGDILAGTSLESWNAWSSWMELSSDGGETWSRFGPIEFPDAEANRLGTIQPTLIEYEPGHVRALFRTRKMGKVAASTSEDGGRTWSPIELTDLDHPGAGIDAVRLADGRCVLIYNPTTRGRSPISAAVSHDGGATWTDFQELERLEQGQRGELSYPNVIQTADGDVHVVYTWNRRRIRHAVIPLDDIPKR